MEYESIGLSTKHINGIDYQIVIRGCFEEDIDAIHLIKYDFLIIKPLPEENDLINLKKHIESTMYLDKWQWDNPRLQK